MTRPLLFLAAVVLGTAWLRGGIGLASLGGATYGGRYYVFVLGAILGYFAFTSEAVPIVKSRKMANWFFISGTTNALANVIVMLGPAFYIFYLILPTTQAVGQYAAEAAGSDVVRIGGFAMASFAVLSFLFANYGIRGLFDWSKPWRFVFLCLTIVAGGLAGFRSALVMLFLLFVVQFYFEGLMRTRFLPIVAGLAVLGFIPILFFSSSMPGSVQRAISFLPVKVDSEILVEAQSSTDWRIQMWDVVAKEVPKYLILGKGYSINPEEIQAVNEASRMGMPVSAYETNMVAGDYHSGPLSVLIPFGIFGVIGFFWVLIGGYQVLYRNYRFGDAKLRRINCVLLSYYLARCFCFFFIFGALSTDLYLFMGLCGFSVSLNGGVKRRAAVPKREPVLVAQQTLAMDPG
ncbi:MAG: O-antigen ligase family protein [Limisphaerales bacterium]